MKGESKFFEEELEDLVDIYLNVGFSRKEAYEEVASFAEKEGEEGLADFYKEEAKKSSVPLEARRDDRVSETPLIYGEF